MKMDEKRWRFEQISQATGIEIHRLESMRRSAGLFWRQHGYTLDEVKAMLGSASIRTPGMMAGSRSKKALELNALLWQDRK